MEIGFFSQRVEAFQKRVSDLFNSIQQPTYNQKQYIEESFVELVKALEELETANAELDSQMEELEKVQEDAATTLQRYRNILQFSLDGYLVTDAAGVIQEANQAACAMLQKPLQFLVRKPVSIWIKEDDRKIFRSTINQAIRTGGIQYLNISPYLKSQEIERVFHFALSPIKNSSGRVETIIWIIRDMTEKHLYKQAAEEYKARFQVIFNNSLMGILVLDKHGHILEANQTAQQITGYKPENKVGLSLVDLFSYQELEHVVSLYSQLGQKDSNPVRVNTSLLAKDGQSIPVKLNITRFDGSTDRPGYALAIFKEVPSIGEDQTKKEIEETVFKSNLAFRQNLAKDLTTGTIEDLSLVLHRMEAVTPANPQQALELEEIRMAVEYVISNLTAKTRNLLSSPIEPFDLRQVTEGFLRQLAWENPSVIYQVEMEDDLENIPESMGQALFNILAAIVQNRVLHVHASQLNIHIQHTQGKIELEIQDNGPSEVLPSHLEELIREGHFEYLQAIEQAEALHGHISSDGSSLGSAISVIAPLHRESQ